MKNTFFALALLVPALAAAAIKLDVTSRYADDIIEHSFQLDQASGNVSITHTKSIQTLVSVEKEEASFVELLVEVKLADQEPIRSIVKATYGEKINLKCPAEGVEAELTFVASQLPAAQ